MELILIILVPVLYFIYDLIKKRREKQLDERLQKTFIQVLQIINRI